MTTIYNTRSNNELVLLNITKGGTYKVQYVNRTSKGYEKVGGIYGWDQDFFNEVVVGEFMEKVI